MEFIALRSTLKSLCLPVGGQELEVGDLAVECWELEGGI